MSNTKVYEIVTKKIIENIERGVVPWKRPWSLSSAPMNLVSGKPYRGFNIFSLMFTNYSSPYWMTFKQAKHLGGTVKKGEKASMVVYWNFRKFEEKDENGKTSDKTIPLVRFYQVFNAEQTEGIDYPKPDLSKNLSLNADASKAIKFYLIREFIGFKAGGDRAFYSPKKDMIHMPPEASFESASGYHSTFFHECGHSTGIKKRLNRGLDTDTNHFGDENYSKEELVAEFTASFLCAEFNLFDKEVEDQSAAYLQSWVKKLQDNPGMLISAANQGQKAAEFIMDRNQVEEEDVD